MAPPDTPSSQAKHKLLLELGRGGMGTVYLAVARGPAGFSKLKVVKHLRGELAGDLQFLHMFLDEARLTARLNHPNITQTIEVGFDGHDYFIEMEYLEGQTLDALLRSGPEPPPTAFVLWILAQALAGLHYAHELADHDGAPLAIVHRDVSPHNVFVTYEGAVKLLDFGIAKAADSAAETRTGVVKGKVTYMAPEQAAREAVDRRADVFAIGVILWQCLAGRRLYDGLSEGEIFLALRDKEVPPVESVRADVAPELAAIAKKATARTREDRYATAAAMQEAIEAWLDAQSTHVGARVLGKLMVERFGRRRAAVRASVDAVLRAGDEPSPVALPRLDPSAEISVSEANEKSATRSLTNPVALEVTSRQSPAARSPSASKEGDAGPGERRAREVAARGSNLRLVGAFVAVAIALAVAVFVRRQSPSASTPALVASTSNDANAAVVGGECKTNRDCRARGPSFVCRASEAKCVSLANDDCKLLAEPDDVDDDATLWLGLLFPLKGRAADTFGKLNENVVELVRRDFRTAGGIPSVRLGGRARRLAFVSCDDSRDAERAARHLASEARVPAVIGFGDNKLSLMLASTVFLPSETLVVEVVNTSPLITKAPQPPGAPRLVWRTTGSAAAYAAPLASLVSWIEPRLAEARRGAAPTATRVALVRSDGPASLAVASEIVSAVRFNGKGVLENGDRFRQFVVHSDAEFPAVVDALAAYRPDVIVYLDAQWFTDHVVRALEDRWGAGARPYYLGAGLLTGAALFDFVGASRDRRARFLSVELPANTDANLRFVLRYNEGFTPRITPGTAPGVTYDAAYLLAYAAMAIGDEPVTGPSLARAFARLGPPGAQVAVGPLGVLDVARELRDGKNVDLVGAGSSLDLDPTTGETTSDFAVYCLGVDDKGRATEPVESGLAFRSQTKTFQGKLACP